MPLFKATLVSEEHRLSISLEVVGIIATPFIASSCCSIEVYMAVPHKKHQR